MQNQDWLDLIKHAEDDQILLLIEAIKISQFKKTKAAIYRIKEERNISKMTALSEVTFEDTQHE